MTDPELTLTATQAKWLERLRRWLVIGLMSWATFLFVTSSLVLCTPWCMVDYHLFTALPAVFVVLLGKGWKLRGAATLIAVLTILFANRAHLDSRKEIETVARVRLIGDLRAQGRLLEAPTSGPTSEPARD